MGATAEVEIQGNQLVLDDELAAEVSKWGNHLRGYIEGHQLVIVPAGEVLDSRHPYIGSYAELAGGEPVIAGTRVSVRAIIEYDRLYRDVERILRALPHLTREQIQDALAYYADHSEEIDSYIERNANAYDQGAREA